MKNWLNRFRPDATAGPVVEIASPADERLSLEVKHAQWQRRGGAGTLTEDIFTNPDSSSPIAGVMITRSDGKLASLGIDLISRTGCNRQASEAIVTHGLSFGGAQWGSTAVTDKGLQSVGIALPVGTHAVLIHSGTVAEKKEKITERVKLIMDVLQNSPLLSTSPNVRQAVVEAIQKEMISLRPLPGTQAQIGGR